MAWAPTGARAPTATWRRTHFQLSPAERRGAVPAPPVAAPVRIRMPTIRCSGPIDADDFRTNGENASDFSNLRQNGLVRITFPLPSNIKLIDPATNAPSAETFVDVWRSVPTVNDVALTGPDDVNPWPRGPNAFGGYQLDARVATLQEQALGALTNHAQIRERAAATASRRPGLVSAGAVHEPSCPRPGRRHPRGHDAAAGSRSAAQRARAGRARSCSSAPAPSATAAPDSRTPRRRSIRFHDISSQCPRPVDTATPARFAFAPCPPRLARNARTYEITLANGTKIRRTSSDPGRALLTGFVGGARPPRTTGTSSTCPDCAGSARPPPTSTTTAPPRSRRSSITTSEFFKRVRANAPPGVVPPVASTDGVHFDRPTPEERAALLAYLRKLLSGAARPCPGAAGTTPPSSTAAPRPAPPTIPRGRRSGSARPGTRGSAPR